MTTGEDGNYTFTQLTPGNYTLKIEAPNFKTLNQTGVVLETNQSLRLNPTLEAGNITEQVTVTAETPAINTETSGKGEVIVEKQVQDLPLNGRNFTDLALLTPGVYRRPADDDQGEGLATSGTRTDASNFILDGINNRSDRNANIGVNTSVDSIQEFRVETSTYSAEFGRTAGAQVNVVSKSGTNRFSGSLFEYVRNNIFDAKKRARLRRSGNRDRRKQKGFEAQSIRRNDWRTAAVFSTSAKAVRSSTKAETKPFSFFPTKARAKRRSVTSVQNRAERQLAARRFPKHSRRGRGRNFGQRRRHRARFMSAKKRDERERGDARRMSDSERDSFRAGHGQSEFDYGKSDFTANFCRLFPASNIPGTLDGYIATGINRPDRDQYLAKFDRRFSDKKQRVFSICAAEQQRLSGISVGAKTFTRHSGATL